MSTGQTGHTSGAVPPKVFMLIGFLHSPVMALKTPKLPANVVFLDLALKHLLGVSQRPLTLILLQKYRDTNGRHIVIQIGGVYTTFCQEEGILLQKYRDRNGRCIEVSGSGVDSTLLNLGCTRGLQQDLCGDVAGG